MTRLFALSESAAATWARRPPNPVRRAAQRSARAATPIPKFRRVTRKRGCLVAARRAARVAAGRRDARARALPSTDAPPRCEPHGRRGDAVAAAGGRPGSGGRAKSGAGGCDPSWWWRAAAARPPSTALAPLRSGASLPSFAAPPRPCCASRPRLLLLSPCVAPSPRLVRTAAAPAVDRPCTGRGARAVRCRAAATRSPSPAPPRGQRRSRVPPLVAAGEAGGHPWSRPPP